MVAVRALARVLLLAAVLSLARAVDKSHASSARKATLAAAVQTQTQAQATSTATTEAHADSEQPLTVLSGLVTPVEVVCTAPSCPKDETIITCTGPLLPPFSTDPQEFCKEKEPCDRDVLSQMKRLWEQRERIAHRDRAERVAQRECLFRQMEKHRKDLTTLNIAAAKIRDKFLQLTRYKANMQARIDAIQNMLKDSTVETAQQYAKIQRERMIAMEKMHEKEKEEEEAAKSARRAAIKAKREREEREDELEKQRAELQKMEIEEEKVKVQEAKQRALAKLRREKELGSKKSSHNDDKEEVDHTKSKLDPEDSVKAKEVETHGHDDDEDDEEEHKKSKKEEEEEQEEEDRNEKAIEKLLHKGGDNEDDEDRGPVGKLPRKIRRTQKATIVDSLGEEVVNNSTASQEAESGEGSGASVAETTPDREKDDSDGDRDDESAHIKVHGADVLVTKKDIASLIKASKKGGEDDEGDDEGADPKPAPKQETAKQKQDEQVHKQVDQQENAAKDALKEAEKAAKS